jgi:outer membrane protein
MTLMVKKNALVAGAALLCFALGASAQTSNKVGVISVQGAIVGTRDGQKASQELDAKFAPRKKDFDSRQSEVASLQDQMNKGGTVLSEDKRNQLARDIDEKKKRLERDMQDAQEELQSEQQRLLQSLGQRMMAVIEKYAKDNGYSIILDVSNPNTPVLFASNTIDITQDIVSLYDKSAPAAGATPTSTPTTGPATTPRQPSGPAPTANKTPGTPRATPGTPR